MIICRTLTVYTFSGNFSWINLKPHFPAIARFERNKYLEYENLREKIEQVQQYVKKLCEKLGEWKQEAKTVKLAKAEAERMKLTYQRKIAEENEKIPIINECIAMFSNMSDGENMSQVLWGRRRS